MKTRKPKTQKKNEIRTHKKNGHPAYIRKKIGDEYIYTTVTHSPITHRVKNDKMSKNPNPIDLEPAYALKKVKRDSIENFKDKKDGWKVARKDKKTLNIRDKKKIKKLK